MIAIEDQIESLLAKKVAAEFSTPEKPRFVAGAMGPGTKLPTLGHIDFDTLKDAYIEQAEALWDGGADLFIVETCQDVLQIKSALNAIEEVFTSTSSNYGKKRNLSALFIVQFLESFFFR